MLANITGGSSGKTDNKRAITNELSIKLVEPPISISSVGTFSGFMICIFDTVIAQ